MKGTVGINFVQFLCGWHLLEMVEFQLLLLPGPTRQHLVIFKEIIFQEFLLGALYLPHYHMYIHLKRGTLLDFGPKNVDSFHRYHKLNWNDVLNFFFRNPKLMLMIFESIAHTSLPACPKFLLTIDRWIWLLIVLGPLIVIASLTHTNPLKRYLYTMIHFSSVFFLLVSKPIMLTDCGYMIFHKVYLVILSVGWGKFDTLVPVKNGEVNLLF